MKKQNQAPGLETEVVHGFKRLQAAAPSLAPPIYMSSAFAFEDADHGAGIFAGTREGYVYSRIANPTVALLEEKIAGLEGGQAAAVSNKLARICYYIIKDQVPFRENLLSH